MKTACLRRCQRPFFAATYLGRPHFASPYPPRIQTVLIILKYTRQFVVGGVKWRSGGDSLRLVQDSFGTSPTPMVELWIYYQASVALLPTGVGGCRVFHKRYPKGMSFIV